MFHGEQFEITRRASALRSRPSAPCTVAPAAASGFRISAGSSLARAARYQISLVSRVSIPGSGSGSVLTASPACETARKSRPRTAQKARIFTRYTPKVKSRASLLLAATWFPLPDTKTTLSSSVFLPSFQEWNGREPRPMKTDNETMEARPPERPRREGAYCCISFLRCSSSRRTSSSNLLFCSGVSTARMRLRASCRIASYCGSSCWSSA